VGVLPSYIEGFGLAVLEMLAAGIPVVAYDVPGPRDTLGKVPRNLLVSAGEKKVMGEKLSDVLQLGPSSYKQLSRSCVQVASQFQWKDIAQNYISKLAEK
jgi:glycosyltransferase involved in cell wall biosynthesis